ncbi:MAG: hypothetical protein LUF25_02560 [Phascolarctobacterium sp.]|nr:hypothetical protein [Phascolarctobacterium sp.]
MDAKIISAMYQCKAMQELEKDLTEEEMAVFRSWSNAKSAVPKSASVHKYRMAIALETLFGWLFS